MSERKLTRYELLAGEHIEPNPDKPGEFFKVIRGQVFESVNDWYANDVRDIQMGNLPPDALTGWPEKFRKVGEQTDNPFTWNPQKETIEQFTERVKGFSNAAGSTAPVSPPTPHPAQQSQGYMDEDSTLRDLENLSVKELQAQAHHAGIDLKGASKKEDILRIIKASLTSTSV